MRHNNYEFIDLYVNPIGEETLFGMHTTPSLRRAPENAAMRFQFSFHARGVHQIVVMLLCVSRQSEVMRLRPNYRHYSLTNFVQRERNWSQAKCLDIHTYLRRSNFQCEEFRVRFLGLAAGSRLVVQNVYFQKACCKFATVSFVSHGLSNPLLSLPDSIRADNLT